MSTRSQEPLFGRVRRRLRRGGATRDEPAAEGGAARSRPPYPDVVEEPTNVGPALDAVVTRARRNQKPVGVDADYDLLREHFDHSHFLLQGAAAPDEGDRDPIATFLRGGARANRSPDYNFSMKNYLDRYPEHRKGTERSPYLEWLKRGREAGEIADPAQGIRPMAEVLGLEPAQVVEELVKDRTDMMERLRTGTLGEMFAKAAELDPLIASAWVETTRTRMIPLQGRFVSGSVATIHACQKAAGFERARVVVVTDGPHEGPGPAGRLAHGLAGVVDATDIVVLHTDRSGTSPEGYVPAGVREVDFAGAAEGLPDEHRQLAFVALLRSFGAEAVVNVDSRLLYAVLTPFGKALAASERLFLFFSAYEPRALTDSFSPPAQSFYPYFDLVEGVITETGDLREELTETYQLSDADLRRIHVLEAPDEGDRTQRSYGEAATRFLLDHTPPVEEAP
jgi:hypothetical protein